jgi:hypothetical protein
MKLRAGWGVLALLITISCAAGPSTYLERHDAVRKSYPSDRYVVGVGEGPTLELARRKAAVEISAQLQGNLRAEGWVEAESDRVDGVERARESVREEIRVETGLARMEWIEVVSARTRGDAVEVFAVLDRRRAEESLRAEIDDRLAGLEAQIARWEETRGILARAQALMALERERRILQSSLDLLAAVSRRPPARPAAFVRLARAQREVQERIGHVEWEICLESEGDESLARVFAGRLAQKGLSTLDCGAEGRGTGPRWILRGRVGATLQQMDHPGGYPFFCATQLDFRVEDEGGTAESGGVAHGLRSGARTRKDACALSAQALADDFLQRIGWESAEASRSGLGSGVAGSRRAP